ncbi:uncharacterized protein [Macrobrachium rosenbergii]|uniref:uncharacterized protein n=1 Tax=Macrobrachium rosenbergii TaxID=79674 RepID=UPI0034D54C55
MPNICALYGCNSNSDRNTDLTFHTFPKNELRKKWIHLCKRKDKFNADSSRICSLHFESSDYARNLKYELLGIPIPRHLVRLNSDAIPTLHLPTSEGNNVSTSREFRAVKRGMKRFIHDIECSPTVNELQENAHEEPRVATIDKLQQELQEVKSERDALLKEKKEWEIERSSLQEKIATVEFNATSLARSNLSKYFSPSQVRFLTGIPVKHWCEDDISGALALRYLSPKAYRYLRNKMEFPYPSISTLHRWVSKINVEPGILTSVLMPLRHKAKTMTEMNRLCVMSFDEMSVAYEWTYDKELILSIHPKVKFSVL